MKDLSEALEVLKQTSRTFFIPINLLPPRLKEAVASAYLCMRAIDEIEDHPSMNYMDKARLLHAISFHLQSFFNDEHRANLEPVFDPYREVLPEVSTRIQDWLFISPEEMTPRICDAISTMAERMALWAGRAWIIHSEADLDCYTFSVAGAVGLLLSDLWAWYDGTSTDRKKAVGFGRGLQAVNILRNHSEDISRGVNFYPDNWDNQLMMSYARRNLSLADQYTNDLPRGPALTFCRIPLALAHATLEVLERGGEKLSRMDVLRVVGPLISSPS
jgi:farnesyl-diphosphate farnesyltransferase